MSLLASVTVEAAFIHEVLLPLVAAALLGGAIGLERELHGRAAGLRTHIMVCLGTTMAMVVSMQLYQRLPADATLRVDPSRIAAGVLTGIGFLGAGAIMKLKSTHRGLTTAACIWFVASLGIAVGAGAYALAVASTLLALLVLLLLARFEHRLHADTYREILLVAECGDCAEEVVARAHDAIERQGMHVQSQEFDENLEQRRVHATFNVRFRRGLASEQVVFRHLRELPGVKSIGWRNVAT
ncbi:MAG TPA: MgtC/SapB family protein [Planctomycetota bacterium]|nr:MgtC/SapB family protein [Planctomycetota bacterium]HRR80698.1 MgtC/SapB family protein [Planctomycetota bacterium]HRT95716.1 MgtC/SapB family protein [Planctomycetota bacterium]